MNRITLSLKQQEIVSFGSGAILVKASAGSGKTRVLTERIKRLIHKTRRKILAITFTNKAGEEMNERLGSLDRIKNRLFIGTFHSFCQQVLENHGQTIGYKNMPHIFEESDRLKLIEQTIQQTPSFQQSYEKLDTKQQKELCYRALSFISEVKRNLLSEDELLNQNHDKNLVLLYTTYQDILNSQNAIDFDDLILLTYNLFIQNTKISALYRRSYEYICIDEAQDLNYAQYQLLRAITINEHQNVMMVGDPNQSIFAFNGSSPEYMTKMFVEDYHPEIIELKENYRSSKQVLRAAEKIIHDSCDIMNTVIEGNFEIHKMDDEEAEAQWVVDKIEDLINLGVHHDIEDDITHEKMAVLARNKYIFKHLTNIFKIQKVPFYYKITPGAIKFESKIMKIFDMAFRVKLNPQDTLHWYKLLELCDNTGKPTDLTELSDCLVKPEYKELLNVIINFTDNGSNLKSSLDRFSHYIEKIKDMDDNDKAMILNDINELLDHWYEYAKRTDKKSLQQFKNSMILGKTHPISQKNGVTLSTVHTMKGQEYDIVFIMGMDDETFPDYRAVRNGGAEMEQEKNNAYVAITRSKRFLYITWPEKRVMPWGDYKHRSISRFLKEF